MFVAILSPYPDELIPTIESTGDIWQAFKRIDEIDHADFVISYGHRELIRKPDIDRFGDRLINLHIGYLPWNRGADPNFWSFVDGTPKGVSIHVIDEGLDTGPLLAQAHVVPSGTLASSYQQLREAVRTLFMNVWPQIRLGLVAPRPQTSRVGSHHHSGEKQKLWSQLALGYETPVEQLVALGRQLPTRA